MELTQKEVKEIFYYENGELFWRETGSGRIREKAGCQHKRDKYIVIYVRGRQYQAHRLIWLYHHGYLPEPEIDHINRNRTDNRIENLRQVSVVCNQRNRGNPQNNCSGIKGVWQEKKSQIWRAGIRVNGKQCVLGSFQYKYEAVLARLAAEQCLNWEGCDSSSPAYRYAKKHKLILH